MLAARRFDFQALAAENQYCGYQITPSNVRKSIYGDIWSPLKTLLSKIKRGWLRFAELLGNFQMIVILSILYWLVLTFVAIPFKIFSDPLGLKNSDNSRWVTRDRPSDILESMRKQG